MTSWTKKAKEIWKFKIKFQEKRSKFSCHKNFLKIFGISLHLKLIVNHNRNRCLEALCWRINKFYCLTKIISLSAAIGRQFIMFEKHFPSPISVGDFFGDAAVDSAVAPVIFDVSLFSLESASTSRLSMDDCVVVDDSSDDSAMFSRSLLSESYMCGRFKKNCIN